MKELNEANQVNETSTSLPKSLREVILKDLLAERLVKINPFLKDQPAQIQQLIMIYRQI